ncbi:hypothetical protein HX837_08005 [Marine Group I thaumarchaeote]|uniref:Baseplate wedge subunit n=1 Tax=Marine Group I thaumarchaeote TaxID=2511932 RepID=A0A7K4MRB2_9ARCH|nr:hypothetical protein [Marine Group I thaumarchaeote]
MAVNDTRLNVTEFDFDDVKDNLKIFLKGQTEFKDYDFEGSGMSVLLDVLAYNTHYLGFNANMLANEMFLDSASLRSSIVSHAKTLGYVPASARAATAIVDVTLNTPTLATATKDAGTVFTTSNDGTDYQFVTAADVTASNIGSGITFNDVKIYEGTFVTTRYTVDTSDADQRFLLRDNRADTNTLTVKIQTSSSDTTIATYTEATDITQVKTDSKVYFLQEVESGKFEIYFGDGVVGTALSDDNIVIITYVVSNKSDANGAAIFTNSGAIATITDVAVATVSTASGGSEAESLKSIKYNAPLDYASQGRCVTAEDYKVYAKKLFANAQSVSVFGGESGSFDSSLGVVSTAEYGKVFISIKSTTGLELTSTEKTQLIKDYAPYTVASTTPVIVDPLTTYLILNVKFKFNSSATTSTGPELESLVLTTLQNYNSSDLEQFEGLFRHSKVLGLIDNTDTAITSNTTNITMAQKFTPTTTAATTYTINFNNAFYNPHSEHNKSSGGIIASTGFYISGDTTNIHYYDDDGDGNLRLYYVSAGARVYADSTAGTITYTTGKIVTDSVYITSADIVDGVASTQIRITAVPDSKDIVPVRNQVLEIDFTNTAITGEVDTVSVGDSGAGTTYTTTSSYSTTSSY